MSELVTLEIPDDSVEWSGEVLTSMNPNRQKFHDQLFPDLPEGKWHIKAVGFAIPVADENESSNG